MKNVISLLIEGKIDQAGIQRMQDILDENKKLKEGYAFEINNGRWNDGIIVHSKEELNDAIYAKYEAKIDECSDLKDRIRSLEINQKK